MPIIIDIFLLGLLALTALAALRQRNLFAVALLSGIYSLLSAGFFTVMDAVDVALTEAAVGAGISTVLILGTLALVGFEEAPPRHSRALPLAVAFITGAVLVYGTVDMPPYGNPANPAHQHVAPHYIQETPHEIGVPNVVSAVLASYRGFDTLGETVVVFTAVVGVLALIGGARRRARDGTEGAGRPG
jgi:multicomponent Na+:H+ antiporter subunit B